MVDFIGRLHPVLLHLPIGFLILGFLMAWLDRNKDQPRYTNATSLAIAVGMWSAIAAAISGYILSRNGGYDERLINIHQWLGIATAVLSIGVYFLSKTKSRFFIPVFGVTMAVLVTAGHFGGSITHGEGFLFEEVEEDETIMAAITDETVVFDHFVAPVFEKKCVSCHNPGKKKGRLILSTKEGILANGKTGDLFEAGNAGNSLLMKRIHLPVEEKKHMPPKGKKQMVDDEIKLLTWWIDQGASFEQTLGESEVNEEIQSIIDKYQQPVVLSMPVNISPVKDSRLQQLRERGIKVRQISSSEPFIEADLSYETDDMGNKLRSLKKVSDQLIEVDLSYSGADDRTVKQLKGFPHLKKVSLQKSKITGATLDALKKHNYLESVNLYGTDVSGEEVRKLLENKAIKKVYLWQTQISDSTIALLENERPGLEIILGADVDIFGDAQLKPPLISAANDIFKDTLSCSLELNFKNVNVFYTLDGSDPDSNSLKYDGPIKLEGTTEVKAIAMKEGWSSSEVASRTFVRAKYKPEIIRLDKPPHERYNANGPESLVDFVKGTTSFAAGNWLGFEKEHFKATMDLGTLEEVSGITVSALQDAGSWIFFPKAIEISVSEDGKTYTKMAGETIPTAAGPAPPEMKNYSYSFEPQKARYIRVDVKSNLVNPQWHPNPGQPCWVFVDEILVE